MTRDLDRNNDLNQDIEDSTVSRALAMAAVITTAGFALAKRREIREQITSGINEKLPAFWTAMREARQNAVFKVLETPYPEEAEAWFNAFIGGKKGSERFEVRSSVVEFMDPDRIILNAEASNSILPGGIHVVQLREDFISPKAPRNKEGKSALPPFTYVVALTGRNLSLVLGPRTP